MVKEGIEMKKAFFHTELLIDTKRFYPKQELFEMMKENLGDRFGKITYTEKKLFGKSVSSIYVEGDDGWVNVNSFEWFSTTKGRIVIGMGEPLKKAFLGLKINPKAIVLWVILCIITLGVAVIIANMIEFLRGIFNLEGTKKNRAMMKAIAIEIEKLVNKYLFIISKSKTVV
jgi:hypothetical protein